ncbi:hypothetical protein LWI29_033732 [Acer saccharum]|uniref:Uncharacterized protein n=1 Tax=Acer saccharum TaxID=4024 RepID=A0AA39VCE8_ACESA|nr:hypothetical protein LWI29_033732 [Acer saccharum]
MPPSPSKFSEVMSCVEQILQCGDSGPGGDVRVSGVVLVVVVAVEAAVEEASKGWWVMVGFVAAANELGFWMRNFEILGLFLNVGVFRSIFQVQHLHSFSAFQGTW